MPLLAGTAVFQPAILTLLNGQVTALLWLIRAGVVYLWHRGRWWQGGLLLPLLALKPNLGMPIIVLLSVYVLFGRRYSALLAEAAGALALMLIGIMQNPHWIGEFMREGEVKLTTNFGPSPTVWGMTGYLCRYNLRCSIPPAAIIGSLLVAGYVCFLRREWNSLSSIWVAGLAVTVTLVITPYTWVYDQLLLILPVIGVTISLAGSGLPFLPSALLLLGIDILAFVLLWIAGQTGVGAWSALVPVSVLALESWALARERLGARRG